MASPTVSDRLGQQDDRGDDRRQPRQRDRDAAGSRPTATVTPSIASQTRLARPRRRDRGRRRSADRAGHDGGRDRRDGDRARRPPRVPTAETDEQQVRRVAQRGGEPEDDAERRVRAVGARCRPRPEIRTTPTSTTGSARSVARDGRSPSSEPRDDPTTMTCRLPRTVASPAPTALDGVVPEHQVAGEEDAGDRGQPRSPDAAAARSAAARRTRRAPAAGARTARGRHVPVEGETSAYGRRRPRTRCTSRRSARPAGAAARSARGRRARRVSVPARRAQARRSAVRCAGTPTKRRPSSSYWLWLRARRRLEHRVAARLGLREGHDLADVRLAARAARPSGRCRARSRHAAARRTRTRRGPPRTSRASPSSVWPWSRNDCARAGRADGSGRSRRRAPSR